jgi:hypothetical protein
MTIKSMADVIRESEQAYQELGFTSEELQTALNGLRGKSLPRQIAEVCVRLAKLEEQLSNLKKDFSNI